MLHRTMELLDAADIGKLRTRWEGPFKVTAAPIPNVYTLAFRDPCRDVSTRTVNVDSPSLRGRLRHPGRCPTLCKRVSLR